MIKIGILGDIGSGKSYVAKSFGYPVFNADNEVGKLYQKDKRIFNKLKKSLPKYIKSFPIQKNEVSTAILANKNNLKKIVKIVHLEIRKKMNIFLNKNRNKKIVILDIPLLLENRINKKEDILVFVQSKQMDIYEMYESVSPLVVRATSFPCTSCPTNSIPNFILCQIQGHSDEI